MKAFLAGMFVFLLMTPLVASGASAGDAEGTFREGNAAFQKGDFAAAIRAYEGLISEGYSSGALYYNLGDAYYRSGDITRAILNYERARRLIPYDEDLLHNIKVARSMTVDRIEPLPRLFLWRYWEALRDGFSIDALAVTGYFAYIVMLAGLLLLFLSGRSRLRRAGAYSGLAGAAVLFLMISLIAARVRYIDRRDTGIVVSGAAEVKNAPDDEGPSAFVLHGGTKVEIADRVGDWIRIRLEDGKVGWMTAEDVEVI